MFQLRKPVLEGNVLRLDVLCETVQKHQVLADIFVQMLREASALDQVLATGVGEGAGNLDVHAFVFDVPLQNIIEKSFVAEVALRHVHWRQSWLLLLLLIFRCRRRMEQRILIAVIVVVMVDVIDDCGGACIGMLAMHSDGRLEVILLLTERGLPRRE